MHVVFLFLSFLSIRTIAFFFNQILASWMLTIAKKNKKADSSKPIATAATKATQALPRVLPKRDIGAVSLNAVGKSQNAGGGATARCNTRPFAPPSTKLSSKPTGATAATKQMAPRGQSKPLPSRFMSKKFSTF